MMNDGQEPDDGSEPDELLPERVFKMAETAGVTLENFAIFNMAEVLQFPRKLICEIFGLDKRRISERLTRTRRKLQEAFSEQPDA